MPFAALVLATLVVGPGVAIAQDSCLIRGRILGFDGKPLPKVRVRPIEPRLVSLFADRDGRFAMRLPCGGGRVLIVSGVHHEDLQLPIITAPGSALQFEVRLRPHQWIEHFDSVRVIGEFNGYSRQTAIPMRPRPDGTFIASVPCEQESLRYQLLGVAKDGLPTAGTLADTFFFRAGRSISSVRAARRPVDVVFDPKLLPRSRRQANVRFSHPRGPTATIYPLFRQDAYEDELLVAAHRAHLAGGGDPDSFRWDESAYVGALRQHIQTERNAFRRQYLLLSYVRRSGSGLDSALARRALDEIPSTSALWSLAPGGPSACLSNISRAIGELDTVRAYAERGSTANPDRDLRVMFLSVAMGVAATSGDKDRLGRYYSRMMDEFPETLDASEARLQYAPNRAIQVGKPAPDFAFSSLEDSTKHIRVSDFRGRFLLLDFWAAWCAPCRVDMPHLHRAEEEFGARGLSILTVSFDNRPEDVVRYRAAKWPMPWAHAFARRGFASQEASHFEVAGIPKAILVGPDGVIVAEDSELRGAALHETLARILGPSKPKGGAVGRN